MELWQALLLGVVQGVTEFLPISSSGHLVLVQKLFAIHLSPESTLAFDIFVHSGTLLSLIYVYRYDLRVLTRFRNADPEACYLIKVLIIGTLPAVVVGFVFKDFFEEQFAHGGFLPYEFMVSGLILLSSKWVLRKAQNSRISAWQAIGVGSAQAFSILPAISRSGATIVGGMWLGLSAERAAHYSFLLAIPAILGATVLGIMDAPSFNFFGQWYLWVGFFSSALVSWLCLVTFLQLIRRGYLHFFAYYCFFAALIAFFVNS